MTEPTPVQRRDAWLALVQHLERELLATRESARACAPMAPIQEDDTAEEWKATAWAAQRLLDSITTLTAPEVPRDDETGQENLLDALAGAVTKARAEREEASVYDIRRTHWQGEAGETLHSLQGLTQPPHTSGDEDEVTCARCRYTLAHR